MRIRRNAAKLLGSATSIYSATTTTTWPSPPPSVAAIAGDVVCELNCSPWDVLDFDFDHYCFSLTNPKKEEDGNRGIIGNIVKTEPISTITSQVKEKKTRRRKSTTTATMPATAMKNKKKISIKGEAAEVLEVTYCKKNDGKGWHCKRAAQLPHTFCSYHIEQLRSYNSMSVVNNNSDTKKTAKSSRNVAASEGGDSNFYYYYNGFGPWRAKKRAGVNKEQEELEKEEEEKEVGEDCNGNYKDSDSARSNVAGGDEYGLDACYDGNDDDDDDDDDGEKCNGGEKRSGMIKKKKKARTRSLKSLL